MPKGKKTVFFCQNCGYESPKWMGQCPGCRQWNTFVEETVSTGNKGSSVHSSGSGVKNKPVALTKIQAREDDRIKTDIEELDRVLGGGIVQGSMVLVGGDPGIGKSTLLLQVCRQLAGKGHKVLYISGEESLRQIKLRAERIGEFNDQLLLMCETNLETIRQTIEEVKPETVVIDSIQTMYNEQISSAPGSVSQVRESTGILMQIAKGLGISVFIVGHVTKDGSVAGPRVLEHMVDTVLYFEGDRQVAYRILRSVKNRFGSTNEIGVFEMQDKGLAEVKNPSQAMLNGRPTDASGSVVVCSIEGTRPILIEIQALVTKTNFGLPRRTSVGIDYNRVNLLMAVAIDLGIVMAIASSYKNKVVDEGLLIFGEVGLSGEIRGVSMAEQRVREAEKLGFTACLMPKANLDSIQGKYQIRLIGASNIKEAMEYI